ncbi:MULTISPECIES: hypothetical protein [unclassified Corallococcus]|uniref:hypothetical protein n=1 Tax=unclassified Corallococcus TaxID=2685029 RepID=UPI001A9010FD|nr:MULTISPECIES: hypothetical protein [unclassified Corallococcus]MBN9684564.1 hypothetical protein [Corallococcus sp. NCSPR001]WAS83963.1 hypothetical protein O0N60_32255 [Corallococcus sp. NCRR]
MRVLLAVGVVALSLGCTRGVRPDSEVAGTKPATGKVYSNEAGEKITLIALEPGDAKKALVAFDGTKSELDGQVLVASVGRDRRATEYWTLWRGRKQRFVSVEDRGGYEDLIFSGVNHTGYTHLKPDTGKTGSLKVEKVFERYQDLEGDKKYQAMLAFDRKFWANQAETQLAEALAETNKACGSKLTSTVAWDSITDAQINEISFGSYCVGPLESLQKLCERSDEAKRTVQQKLQAVECRMDAKAALKLEAQKVIWTVTSGETVQPDATTSFFTDTL